MSTSVRPPPWLLALGRPYALLASAAHTVSEVASFLHHSVGAMDRDVIEDIPRAFRSIGGRSGPKANAQEGGGAFITALLAVMVALLSALVLSSFFLR